MLIESVLVVGMSVVTLLRLKREEVCSFFHFRHYLFVTGDSQYASNWVRNCYRTGSADL
jgi:hypothetical protein